MKRYIWSVMALALVANSSEFVVVEQSKNSQVNMNKSDVKQLNVQKSEGKQNPKLNFELIKIKENNTTRSMLVPVEEIDLTGITRETAVNNKLNSKDGLLINFIDKNTNIEAFELSFNVKLKEKLQIGYYIFENNSASSDMVLMNTILASNEGENIETIKPNWKMQMKKF